MSPQEIEKLKKLLQRLKAEDKNLRVFGASGHKYTLRPTLTESQLQEFEQTHQIKLPKDYRFFLKEVGNGGAGPGYGLYPLNKTTDIFRPDIPFSLSSLKPLSDGWQSIPLIDEEMVPGILEIETKGCAYATYLVINGDTYGTIWNCWSVDEVFSSGLTFSAWYQKWINTLETFFPMLEREREAEPIKEGMTKQEAINRLDGQWWIKEPEGTNRRILIFDGLTTQFELSKDDKIEMRLEFTIL